MKERNHSPLIGGATLVLLLALDSRAQAQSEAGGLPYSALHALETEVQSLSVPLGPAAPLGLSLSNAGTWSSLPGGSRLWRLRLGVPEAASMALDFKHYSLPPGAALFVYDDSKSEQHGAFGPEHNAPDGRFSLHPIPGAALTLEYFEPAEVRQAGILVLDAVHSLSASEFTGQEPIARGAAGDCQVDVACEEGLRWQRISRSIVKISGSIDCTGVLINNTSGDGTPYVLTANHCGSLQLANFWFNWKRPQCGQEMVKGEQQFASIFGSDLMVQDRIHDFQLVRLSSTPPAEINAHYAGWDWRGEVPIGGTTLHHPLGNVMKISIERQKPLIHEIYWKIRRWDVGITEGGSSGAPLFDHEQRVVGQLKGGQATCKNPRGDLFGRLELEWEQLAPFLDPIGSSLELLDGMELEPALRELAVTGFLKPSLEATETLVSLHGMGFKRHPKVFIDGERLPDGHARWVSNSRIDMQWSGLEPGEHSMRLGYGEELLEFTFSVCPEEDKQSEHP